MSKAMTEKDPTGNGRLVLLTIIGIPLTMILAATWLWYFVVRGDLDLVGFLGTANRGQLLKPPRQLDEVALLDHGVPFKYADLDPKWTLAVAVEGASCDRHCERNLYLTRQIHIALGKEFNRVGRLYLSEAAVDDSSLEVRQLSDQRPPPASLDVLLQTEHRGTRALQLAAGGYQALFPENSEDPTTWYLIDPAGWVMMSYNSQIDYKDVISDLKFLLKNSSE